MKKNNTAEWRDCKQQVVDKLDIETEYRALELLVCDGSPNAKGWLEAHCFGIEDRTPSAGINVGDGPLRGRYKDHRTGESLSIFDFAVKVGKCSSYKDALVYFAKKVGAELPDGSEESPAEKLDRHSLTNVTKSIYAEGKAGVTVRSIEEVGGIGGYYPKNLSVEKANHVIAFPMFGSALLDADPTGFHCVPAFPNGKIRKYRGKGKDPSLLDKLTLGEPGLMNVDALNRLLGAEVVHFVEGITDLLAVQACLGPWRDEDPQGRKHVVVSAGACTYYPKLEWMYRFSGKDCVQWFDVGDQKNEGQVAAAKWAAMLLPVAKSVRNVQLPLGKDGGKNDIRAWLVEGRTFADMLNYAAKFEPIEPGSVADQFPDDGSVHTGIQIDVSCEDLPRVTSQALQAIQRANEPPTLFKYAGRPVRIELNEHGNPIIRELTQDRMRYALARCAEWHKTKEDIIKLVAPPMDVVRDVLASPDIQLPELQRMVRSPVFGRDGSLANPPGYFPSSRILYVQSPELQVATVSNRPSAADVSRARDLIVTELLGDFPFTSESELAHAVGCFLLYFARDLINGPTPLHLIEKPAPGTGATLLVQALTDIATGRPAAAMTDARDEEEARKRLTSKLIAGDSFMVLDNVRRLDSPSLAAAVTSLDWDDRLLGSTQIITVPVRCTWLATGNNPKLSNEISRRTVRIRLDSRRDQPWLRDQNQFRHPDLLAWATAHRGELIWAAVTLIQSWLAAGRPAGKQTLGMFEAWAKTIGGILDVARIPGFLGNIQELYRESDVEGQMWRTFLLAWLSKFGSSPVGVADLMQLISDNVTLPLGDGSERSQKTRMGKLLADQRDRVYRLELADSELFQAKIVRGKDLHQAAQWRLQCVVEDVPHVPNVPIYNNPAVNSMGTCPENITDFDHVPTDVPISQLGNPQHLNDASGNIGNMGTYPYACAGARTGAHAHAHTLAEERSQGSQGSHEMNGHVGNCEALAEEAAVAIDGEPADEVEAEFEQWTF